MDLENLPPATDFIREAINEDLRSGRYDRVQTRFPPRAERLPAHRPCQGDLPSTFGMAENYGGVCNLRFDDTNPVKEDIEYVDSIKEDVRWLGFDWEERIYYASDYFDQMYEYAVKLIKKGKAYVCDLTAEEIRHPRHAHRAGQREPVSRPQRRRKSRPVRAHAARANSPTAPRVLRAKIDMASPNINLRDPVMYRILHAAPPPHRQCLVHLPDVRLCPRSVGFDRRHHPFDVLAGI